VRRRHSYRSQQGFTLLETMLTVVLTALLVAPLVGWAFVASRQQVATITRNIDGASVGFLRTTFLRDVASSHTANVGTAANGTDCAGGSAAAAAPTDTVLRLVATTGPRVVYNRAASSDGTGVSIWRRECTGGTATSESELVRDIDPASVAVACTARPGMGSSDCGRISMRVDTVSGQVVSMTASLRAGVAIGVVTGGNSGPVYVSPDVTITASDLEVYRGESVNLAGTATDPGGSTMTYRWELGDGTTSTNASVDHVYTQLGEFTAVFTATTAGGTPASDFVRIRVLNRPPTAVISAPSTDPLSVNRCENVSFAAAGSVDNDNNSSIVRYIWAYGDGDTSTRTGPGAHTHKFTQPRSSSSPYIVNLRVEDADHDVYGNGAGEDTTKVVVTNRAPNTPVISGAWGSTTAAGGSSLQVTTPATVNFSVTGPTPLDADGTCDTLSYQWLKGGVAIDGATSATYAHAAAGAAAISLRITDDQGEAKTSSAVNLTTNTPPVAAFTLSPSPVRVGKPVTINNSSTDNETATGSLTHAWTFPSGTPASSTSSAPGSVSFTHNVGTADTFVSATYSVGLTVTDPSGAANATTRSIVVNGAPAPTNFRKTAGGCQRSNFFGCQERYIDLAWSAVTDVAATDSYQIHVKCTTALCGDEQTRNFTGTSTRFAGLSQGLFGTTLTYDARIRARDVATGKWGPWSAVISVNSQ